MCEELTWKHDQRFCMGCRGYVVWVAVDMLHGLPWFYFKGLLGYVAWVDVVMLSHHMKVKSTPTFRLGGGV